MNIPMPSIPMPTIVIGATATRINKKPVRQEESSRVEEIFEEDNNENIENNEDSEEGEENEEKLLDAELEEELRDLE